MSAEACAKALSRALHRRRSQVTLSVLGRASVLMRRLLPRLMDRITYRFIAREAGSPFQ